MATTGLRQASAPRAASLGEPSIIRRDEMMAGMMGGTDSTSLGADNGTSLIARAEALNAFMKMQPVANQARQQSSSAAGVGVEQTAGCFCLGSRTVQQQQQHGSREVGQRSKREYYPDNLSIQPNRHKWGRGMEWLIIACVEFLERDGLDERNIFAVSAVDDLVRNMAVGEGQALPRNTDPHVAAGVIKAQIRHADEALVSKDCLRGYIEVQQSREGDGAAGGAGAGAGALQRQQQQQQQQDGGGGGNSGSGHGGYSESHLARTVDETVKKSGARRAYVLARIMRLLGRVSANEEVSRMNAHCLAKCVAPSMLHWDPNSGFALLMLGKITAFVMAMIEDARVFDEKLCQKIDQLCAQQC